MAGHNEEGTGKHPHKSTEEPYPHHEGKSSKEEGKSSQHEGGHSSEREKGAEHSQSGKGNESGDLKEREYRDNKGEIHHHTHTYEEQHKK